MKHTVKGDTVTVYLDGELDHHTAKGVRAELEALIESPRVKRLFLDLSGLTFMDSSGIGVVLGRYKTLSRRGGTVAVRQPTPHVNQIFRMSGLYQIVEKL